VSENNNEALIEYMQEAEADRNALRSIELGTVYAHVDREGNVHRFDTLDLADAPLRSRGTVTVHSAPSFVAAVQDRAGDCGATVVYADEVVNKLVAVLNDDTTGDPGWRDYRVELGLRRTSEWDHWRNNQGLKAQKEFALVIEDGLDEIRSPAAATMLELAQTFTASIGAKFKQQARLDNGARQLTYEEEIDAKAGNAGALVIPAEFTLEVRPFYGSGSHPIQARLRFEIKGGELSIGYFLVRPHEVEREAFAFMVDQVETGLELTAIRGVAPSSAS
jgi:uncharacterized protein YfdQ (DUF2303 family)